MIQVETTKDILFLALAFGVILIALVSAWAIFYVAMILRQMKEMVTDVRLKVAAVENLIKKVGEKMSNVSEVGKLVVDSARVAVDACRMKTDRKRKK